LREPPSLLLLSKTIPVPRKIHVISKGLRLLQGALGVAVPSDPKDYEFPLGITAEHEREATEVAGNGNYVILNPAGGWPTKLWSPERFGFLADRLWNEHALKSLVTFGPGESQLAETVVQSARAGGARAVSLSLKGFVALARKAQIYVGGDTGPTHLAVAAGTPIVGLFGPTEWWRNGSPLSDDLCVERTDIDCRVDCHRRACSKWICMDIGVGRVFEAVTERLGRAGRLPLRTAG
jgi:ADP-heptose:LPS heptosyltransferase